MAATTFTSIVMVAFAVLVLTLASYAWFGDWEPQPRRTMTRDRTEADVEAAVAEMRRAIAAYEREQQR